MNLAATQLRLLTRFMAEAPFQPATNLWRCVELPVLVDKNGLQPTRIGAIPPQLAAMMQTNINVQSLTVEAALTGKREHVYHAAMLDPHTAAVLDLSQIRAMVDELLVAHSAFLPDYLQA